MKEELHQEGMGNKRDLEDKEENIKDDLWGWSLGGWPLDERELVWGGVSEQK